jgi:NAD-dependent deacetylase
MLKNKEILIITGAGVSAPSGIPTFRGKNGLYNKKFEHEGKEYEPEEFITKNFFDQHPKPIWDWVEEIYKMANTCKPNKIHLLIDKLATVLNARGKKVTIVTQNIDDLHLKPKEKGYGYFAIHGNVKLVRCDNLHLSPYQQFREEIKAGSEVKCPKCELFVRPHVLFFD